MNHEYPVPLRCTYIGCGTYYILAADPTQIQSRIKRVYRYLEGTICLNRVYECEVNLCSIIYLHRVCSPRHTFVVVFVLVLHLHSLLAAAVFYFYHPFPYPLVAVHFRAG